VNDMHGIDITKLPRHIAIIMDGNGRWAQRHTLGRVSGHKKGAEAVRATVRTCRELGIRYLTLYAFSSENWQRPRKEVDALMRLLKDYVRTEMEDMLENNIRLVIIGDVENLDRNIQGLLRDAVAKTAHNDGLNLNIALSYGGRDEIVVAVKRMIADCRAGKFTPDEITKEMFAGYLYTMGMPDPDLLIRTSGEFRISNFLLWQMAYTEFYFTDVLWPDFSKDELLNAIAVYQQRERRFGLTKEDTETERPAATAPKSILQ
jgi:undecaprenyl diphosphate synthase